MGEQEVEAFLTHLAVNEKMAVKTQALALNSLNYLYREILAKPLSLNMNFHRANKDPKLPTVLTQEETRLFFMHVNPIYELPLKIMYGSGLRLMECVRLRNHDVDFHYGSLQIWQGKGNKNRIVTLAKELYPLIKQQQITAKKFFEMDTYNPRYRGVYLPNALARKYQQAPLEWNWHYLFPSYKTSGFKPDKTFSRHHISESSLQRAVKHAVSKAGIKNV